MKQASLLPGDAIQSAELEFLSTRFGYTLKDFIHLPSDFHQYFRSDATWALIRDRNGQIISCASISPIHYKEKTTPLYRLGLIATKLEFEGQGYASECITALLRPCDSVVCWSDRHDFYKKFGFNPWNEEFYLSLKNAFPNPNPSLFKIQKGFHTDIPKFQFQHSESNLLREEKSWELCKSSRVDTYYIEVDGSLKAYALINKGKDLTNICHEIIAIDDKFLIELAKSLPSQTIFLLSSNQYEKFPNSTLASAGIQALLKNSIYTDWIYGLDSC